MWQARFYQFLPKLVTEHPKARWLFLTLTVRNCPVTELGDTLTAMNAAWQRLKDRKEFRPYLAGYAPPRSHGARTAAHTRTFTPC